MGLHRLATDAHFVRLEPCSLGRCPRNTQMAAGPQLLPVAGLRLTKRATGALPHSSRQCRSASDFDTGQTDNPTVPARYLTAVIVPAFPPLWDFPARRHLMRFPEPGRDHPSHRLQAVCGDRLRYDADFKYDCFVWLISSDQ